MFKVPEKYRVTKGRMASTHELGNNGCFMIPLPGISKSHAYVMASDGAGWEHVSVHIAVNQKKQFTPTWSQMCLIKGLFWGEEDAVMQLHPAKKDYVNNHPNVLHLWRPVPGTGVEIPKPESILVGFTDAELNG